MVGVIGSIFGRILASCLVREFGSWGAGGQKKRGGKGHEKREGKEKKRGKGKERKRKRKT